MEETHIDCNSFLLMIIGHSDEKGHLFDVNKNRSWLTDDIVSDLRQVGALRGKPKVMIFYVDREGKNQCLSCTY